MRNLFDTHNHSQFSFDGKSTSVEKSAAAARAMGLGGIVFTDHYDIYIPDVEGEVVAKPQDFDIIAQQTEIERVQRTHTDDFKVLKGIEVGMNIHSRQDIGRMLKEHNFDQVIASIHYLEDCDPYYGGYFQGKDWKTAYGIYLETIYNEMVSLEDFDIVGHFDYVVRYAPYEQDSITYKDFSDVLDSIFKYLIENGKGLEINTKSCVGTRGRKTVLDRNLLLRYKEMGGEIISLGSDSHRVEQVGESFEAYTHMLRSAGLRWTAHYEKRQLVQLPL